MSQSRGTDQDYLSQQQYHNSDKLSARIRLHRDYSTEKDSLWRWYFDLIQEFTPDTAQVLEVGTGRGDLWAENRDRIPASWSMTLTDMSAGMLDDNRKHLGDLTQRMTYQVADVMQLPFEDASFDIIFANWMLYHVPDITQGISEMRRVLKPDGILFAGTNGDYHMREVYQIAGAIDQISDWQNYFVRTFSLQNGAEKLSQYFGSVQRHDFDSNLWVTDAQAIIDYIASMMGIDGEVVMRERESQIRADLEAQIAEKGGVFIGKESGLFIATGYPQN